MPFTCASQATHDSWKDVYTTTHQLFDEGTDLQLIQKLINYSVGELRCRHLVQGDSKSGISKVVRINLHANKEI
jgi:hypothetical protein